MGERPNRLYEVLIAMHRYSGQHIFDEMQLDDFYFGAALGAGRLSKANSAALIRIEWDKRCV